MNRLGRPFVCTVVLLTSACATPGSKRLDAIRAGLDEASYTKPLDEVWQDARLLLDERGYPLVGEDAKAVGRSELSTVEAALSPAHETSNEEYDVGTLQALASSRHKPSPDKQWMDTGWNQYRERYHVEGRKLPDGCRVVFYKVKQDMASGAFEQRERDVQMELELARRADPDLARRLEERADRAAK